jgi:hypothetical protein
MSDMTRETVGAAIIRQIENTLKALEQEQARFDTMVKELETEGYRIVNGGGQTIDGPDELYTDWRTGAVLGDDESPDHWYHIDHVHNETCLLDPIKVRGLPDGLPQAIVEWAVEHEAKARAWLEGIQQ